MSTIYPPLIVPVHLFHRGGVHHQCITYMTRRHLKSRFRKAWATSPFNALPSRQVIIPRKHFMTRHVPTYLPKFYLVQTYTSSHDDGTCREQAPRLPPVHTCCPHDTLSSRESKLDLVIFTTCTRRGESCCPHDPLSSRESKLDMVISQHAHSRGENEPLAWTLCRDSMPSRESKFNL